MAKVEAVLRDELGMAATSRLKTSTTIIDKLKREKTRLATMQDLAGVRIVEDMSLLEQNRVVQRITKALPNSKIIDRRDRPSFNYRAVHVIASIDGLPVEIQIRTRLQDEVAQITEKLADLWGRQIRYGGLPDDPDLELVHGTTRKQLVEVMTMKLYKLVESTENQGYMQDLLDEAVPHVEAGKVSMSSLEETTRMLIEKWRDPDHAEAERSKRAELEASARSALRMVIDALSEGEQ